MALLRRETWMWRLMWRSWPSAILPPALWPRAPLWLGPDGIGKHRWAHRLARRILCIGDSSEALAPAPRAHKSPTTPISSTLSDDALKIEAVRGVIERCVLRPLVSRHRVVLVRDAHALTIGAQNAFLKTLPKSRSGKRFSFLLTHRGNAAFCKPFARARRSCALRLLIKPGLPRTSPELAPFAAASGGLDCRSLRMKDSEVASACPLLRANPAGRATSKSQSNSP